MNSQGTILQIEANYLGCLLKDSSLIDEALLTERNLSSQRHKQWLKIIMDFHKQEKVLDFSTALTLSRDMLESIGGTQYMAEMMNGVAFTHGFKTYQNTILNYCNVQRGKDIALDFLQNVSEFADPEQLQKFMSEVTKLETSTVKKTDNFKSHLKQRMEEHMSAPVDGLTGVDTGSRVLNLLTDGWPRKNLTIVGARPSMGKTLFGLGTLLKGMMNDPDIFPTFISAEMSTGGIIDRAIAQMGGINLEKLRNVNKYMRQKADVENYRTAVGILEKSNFEVFEDSTVPEIRARMRQRVKDHPGKKHICVIDYLTQLSPVNGTGNANYDYGEMTKEIKEIAKDLDIPVILLVQLNRNNESRENKRPTMSDIRDSGQVEQAGDIIAFLHREDYYNRDAEPTNLLEFIIAKNRQGRTGTVKFKVDLATQNFYDTERV